MKTEKQIIYDDENAARFVENIKGWIDINNRFYGNNPDSEHMARWSSCTHQKCECGKLMTKGWTKCDECRTKAEIERYSQLQFKEYNGDLVYSHLADKYFRDSDEIEDYCSDEEIDPKDLRLVFCEPNEFSQIDSDYWDTAQVKHELNIGACSIGTNVRGLCVRAGFETRNFNLSTDDK